VLSSSATTSAGNQSVIVGWTPSSGALSYNISACGTAAGLSACPTLKKVATNVTANPVTLTSFTVGAAPPTLTTAGVTGVNSAQIWAPAVNVGAGTGASLAVTGNLDGLTGTVKTTGTTANLCTFNLQNTFNQEATAGAGVTYTLCTAVAGKRQCVFNSNGGAPNTGILTVATSAAGQFIIYTDGTLTTSGGNVTSSGAAADGACFIGVDGTHWQQFTQSGSWAPH
jgi:hypothetical protein